MSGVVPFALTSYITLFVITFPVAGPDAVVAQTIPAAENVLPSLIFRMIFPFTLLFVPVVVVEVPIDQLSEPTPIPTLSAPAVVFVEGPPTYFTVLYSMLQLF